jgi:hypothetical protein
LPSIRNPEYTQLAARLEGRAGIEIGRGAAVPTLCASARRIVLTGQRCRIVGCFASGASRSSHDGDPCTRRSLCSQSPPLPPMPFMRSPRFAMPRGSHLDQQLVVERHLVRVALRQQRAYGVRLPRRPRTMPSNARRKRRCLEPLVSEYSGPKKSRRILAMRSRDGNIAAGRAR